MFKDNKYTRWYFQIMANPDVSGTTERHHIIPVSLGGDNCKENIVAISARQHAVAHKLLPRMVVCKSHRRKMLQAVWCMTWRSNTSSRGASVSSREYETAKNALKLARLGVPRDALTRKKIGDAQRGKPKGAQSTEHRSKISQSMKNHKISEETRARMSAASKRPMTDSAKQKLREHYARKRCEK